MHESSSSNNDSSNTAKPSKPTASKLKPNYDSKKYWLPQSHVSLESATGQRQLIEHVLAHSPLFSRADDPSIDSSASIDTTFITTGFGLRNVKSLQDALRASEAKKRREIREHGSKESLTVKEYSSGGYSGEHSVCSDTLHAEAVSQTDESMSVASSSRGSFEKQRRLRYLMGLASEHFGEEFESIEHESLPGEAVYEGSVEESLTEAMKQAQRYLKSHRIFEFFQFLVAHMLSKLPSNPIEFIIDLLDKCLVYRSGFGEPPLLYSHRHLEQLFNLMDPMRTGYIEPEQYKTGMVTLGICSYNKTPPLSKDGLVSKTVFVEEAYDCLSNLLNSMVRRRWVGNLPPVTPPPTPQVFSVASSSREGCYQPYNKV